MVVLVSLHTFWSLQVGRPLTQPWPTIDTAFPVTSSVSWTCVSLRIIRMPIRLTMCSTPFKGIVYNDLYISMILHSLGRILVYYFTAYFNNSKFIVSQDNYVLQQRVTCYCRNSQWLDLLLYQIKNCLSVMNSILLISKFLSSCKKFGKITKGFKILNGRDHECCY